MAHSLATKPARTLHLCSSSLLYIPIRVTTVSATGAVFVTAAPSISNIESNSVEHVFQCLLCYMFDVVFM